MNDNSPPTDRPTSAQHERLHAGEAKSGFELGRRVVIGLVALIVVGYFFLPLLNSGENESSSPVPASAEPVETNGQRDAPATTAQANPESAEAQFELGNAHYEAGEFDQAVQAYQQAIALNPNYQAAYANLGVTYYQQQKFDLAATQYEKALELDADDGDVAYNLGALYLQQALSQGTAPNQALLDQAITQLEQAQQISPELAEPYFTLGVAFLAKNQPQEALDAFETFLSFERIDPKAREEAERYLQSLQDQ